MKAIIPAAGLGTRFLPATRCMPKELLPVLDKPILQYVVEEALEPQGVDGVVIVNSREKPQIEQYFSVDEQFEGMLRERGKDEAADRIHEASTLPVSFVYQDNPRGLGHAVHCAAEKIDGEPFFVLLGDYFVPDKLMCVRMAQVSREHNGASVIAVAPVPADQVSRYGIIAGQCVGSLDGSGCGEEDELATQAPGAGNEIQLTDAMQRLLDEEEMYALVVDPDEGCDTGTPAAWAATNARMALKDPHTAEAFREALGDEALG